MKDPAKMSKDELRNEVYKLRHLLETNTIQWTDTSLELPSKEGVYLCAFSDGDVQSMDYIEDGEPWEADGEFVTHWAEAPKHPDLASQ